MIRFFFLFLDALASLGVPLSMVRHLLTDFLLHFMQIYFQIVESQSVERQKKSVEVRRESVDQQITSASSSLWSLFYFNCSQFDYFCGSLQGRQIEWNDAASVFCPLCSEPLSAESPKLTRVTGISQRCQSAGHRNNL